MTSSLQEAFAKASGLPEAAQEQLAEQLLEDIEGELRWHQTLASSQDLLEKMATAAISAQRKGQTQRKGFDEL